MNNLIERVGFDDGHGNLSFNKLVTCAMCVVFALCALREIKIEWPLLSFGVVVLGAGFGLKGYLAAVKQNTLTAQLTHEHKMALAANITGDVTAAVNTVAQGLVHRLDARSPHGGE